jgi:hypothetical protein
MLGALHIRSKVLLSVAWLAREKYQKNCDKKEGNDYYDDDDDNNNKLI